MSLEGHSWELFREYIGNIVGGCDVIDFYVSFLNLFADIMVAYVDMFDFYVVLCVLR